MTDDAGWRRRTAEVAELVVWAATMREPTLGEVRLVCIDGPAGSGKSELGRAVHDAAAATGTAALVQLDDLLEGWRGLPEVSRTLERDVLSPLAAGRAARYRRYDWDRGRFGGEQVVEPVDLLVVEGVGSGAASYSSWMTLLVWVEAPRELRLARGIARDGEALRPQWQQWMADEEALFRREHTRARADMTVDGTGEARQAVVFE